MDGTIVTVALPSVGEELGADSHALSYWALLERYARLLMVGGVERAIAFP